VLAALSLLITISSLPVSLFLFINPSDLPYSLPYLLVISFVDKLSTKSILKTLAAFLAKPKSFSNLTFLSSFNTSTKPVFKFSNSLFNCSFRSISGLLKDLLFTSFIV